jgi:hypothetical protein
MTTIAILSVPFTIVASGIFIDLATNSGGGISSIMESIRGKKTHQKDEKIIFAEKILSQLDDLRDDLTYDNSPEDEKVILDKIKDREKILEKILENRDLIY